MQYFELGYIIGVSLFEFLFILKAFTSPVTRSVRGEIGKVVVVRKLGLRNLKY